MNFHQARIWIICASFVTIMLCILFFITAPYFNYPISIDQSQRLIEIITPVFTGYIIAAIYYKFGPKNSLNLEEKKDTLLKLLVKGPFIIFILGMIVVLTIFWITNSKYAQSESGMSFDNLTFYTTFFLVILASSINILAFYLFQRK